MSIQRAQAVRIQPIAAVAIVAGIVIAAATRLQGPGAAGALVLFCLGLAVTDGIGKQRFSLRQAVVFLLTIGAGLGTWGLAVLFLLGAVDIATSVEVRAVLIVAGACVAGAVLLGLVKLAVGRGLVQAPRSRGKRGSASTGFERGRGGSRAGASATKPAQAGRAAPSPLPGSAAARAQPPRPARRGRPG